jgi:hypothetical protein
VVNGDEDAEIMEQRIFVLDVGITEEMVSSSAPYINFHLEFINTSIFSITLESFIGRVFVDKEEQKDRLETRPEGHVFRFPRASVVSILLRQWVPPGVVDKMRNQSETIFDLSHVILHRGEKRVFTKPLTHRNAIISRTNWDKLVGELPTILKQ